MRSPPASLGPSPALGLFVARPRAATVAVCDACCPSALRSGAQGGSQRQRHTEELKGGQRQASKWDSNPRIIERKPRRKEKRRLLRRNTQKEREREELGPLPQTPVTFEDVVVYFTPEEWGSLAEWQRQLYREVMEGNFELVASLGSMPPKPELLCKLERGEEPYASDPHHSGMWDAQGTPGADDWSGSNVPEVTIKQEPGFDWSASSSPPLWGSSGPNSHPFAFCPSWFEVKLMDVRSLASEPSLERPWSPSQEEPLVCRECRRSFADGDSLRRHPCAIHRAAAAEEKDGETEEEEEEEEKKKGPFACPSCGKAFRYLSNLLTHKKHRGKRPHACAQCKAHFCLQGDLLRHRASHTAEGAYRCGVCSLVFQHKWLLAAHKAEEHLGAKGLAFQCQDCSQAFATKSELLRHQRVEHEEDQPFVCPTCGECFSWRESLQIHQRKHGPERAFQCPLCGKGFTRRRNLLTHQRVHTGELPFDCPDCGRAFPSKASLTAHGRLHRRERPFPCPLCGRCFRLQAKLLEHQASHGPPEVKEEAKA